MKEIASISLERLNNGAHFLFATNMVAHAEADTKLKEKTASLITALRTAVTQEDTDLKISQKSLLTDDIVEADAQRDALFGGYKKAVKGYDGFPVADIAAAAKVLLQHLKDYNIDPQGQLDKETGLLINFISDLEGKYASQVTALSLTPFVTNLKVANEKVRSLTSERTDESMTRPIGALKASRTATDAAYRNLVKMVNALAMVEGEADYASFIDYVNTEIVHYKREVIGQKSASPRVSAAGNVSDKTETPVASQEG